MSELLTLSLLFAGAIFLLLAALGVLRMPDLFSRMQAATKAATLGAGLMLLAVAAHFDDTGTTVRALLVTAFFFLTAPVAAHMIGRAAYIIGVPLWEGTITDELRGAYDPQTHALGGDYKAQAPAGGAAGEDPPAAGPAGRP
ncbi:MAG TPA: monovalent cation/H(+) antiporter subunit G [Pyrinomonadaceae bacterium]|nr:monovalent cation/H(+) antiporter subunit G [Pyrinomonadaceae bacterium]